MAIFHSIFQYLHSPHRSYSKIPPKLKKWSCFILFISLTAPTKTEKSFSPDQQPIIMRGSKRKHPNSIYYVEICNPKGSKTTEVQVQYEIKAILGHRVLNQGVKLSPLESEYRQNEFKNVPLDQMQFLVKWVGEPEPTWEPGQNLKNAPLLLQSYKQKFELEQNMSAPKPTAPKTRGRKPKNPSNPAKPKGPRSRNFNFNRVYTDQNDGLKSEEEDELLIIDKETYIKGTKWLPEDEPHYQQRDQWKMTPPREKNKKDMIKDNQDQSFQRDAYYDESPQEKSERHKSKRETLGEKIQRKQRIGKNNQFANIHQHLSMNLPDILQKKGENKSRMKDILLPAIQKRAIQEKEAEKIIPEPQLIVHSEPIVHMKNINNFEIPQNKTNVETIKNNQILGDDLLNIPKPTKEASQSQMPEDYCRDQLYINPSDQLIDKFMNERIQTQKSNQPIPPQSQKKHHSQFDRSMCLEDYLNLPALIEDSKQKEGLSPQMVNEQHLNKSRVMSSMNEIIEKPEQEAVNKRKCPSEYNQQETVDKTSKKQKLNEMSPFLKERKHILMIDIDDSEEIKAVIAQENREPPSLKERIHNQLQNLLAHDHFNEQSLLEQSERLKNTTVINPEPTKMTPVSAQDPHPLPPPISTISAAPEPVIQVSPPIQQQIHQSEYSCGICVKHQQHNQSLRQLYNQLLHSNELNLDNIFLEQEVLSVLSTLNPNSSVSERFIRKQKMSDVSSNSVLNTLLLRKLSGIEELTQITRDFEIEKLVKMGELWVAIYQIKTQRRGTRREHFKYVPASLLIQHSRETIISFLIK